MRKIVLINCLWAAVATGAFFIGQKDKVTKSIEKTNLPNSISDTTANRSFNSNSSNRPGKSGATERSQSTVKNSLDPNLVIGTAESKLKGALNDFDPIRRNATISQMLLELTPANASEMLAAFENSPGGRENDRHFNDFLYAWARVSGEDALKYAMDPESPKRTRGDEMTAISGWAASDPNSAMSYVENVENPETRQWMHLGVTKEMIKNDLDGAIAYSEKNMKSRARGEQMDRIADALVEQRGEQGLIDWINGIDHTVKENDMLSYKTHAIRQSVERIARNDREKAIQFIADNAQEPFVDSDTLERTSRYVSRTSIADEVQWLADLPEGIKGQRHALGERFEEFIKEDFAGAGEWLAGQTLGPAYDEAIQDYAMSAAKDNPEAALAWVDRISDERLRNYTLGRLKPREKKE
tara:strand:- start:1164 stop:2399 length:1236 start_codon:yes stop_codon:yes gene_type:complete